MVRGELLRDFVVRQIFFPCFMVRELKKFGKHCVKGMEKVLSEKYIKPDGEEIYYYQTVTQNALSYILANLKEIIKGEKGIFETGGSRSYDTIKI